MTIINGANHNVEDILASIRTSIADDHGPARLIAGDMNLPARREPAGHEEAAEFELPAIFKPGHTGTAEKPKLFGRLSDALKTTAAAEPRGRTVIPFDPSVAGRMLEPPQSPAQMQAPVQPEQPRGDVQPEPSQDVKRVMPTFFDTRLNRMGELTRKAYEPEPEPAPAPQPPAAKPPALPDKSSHADHTADAVDDAAAQLLRPMLRQWLQDNMPKIVEKALLSEIQGDPTPKPRK